MSKRQKKADYVKNALSKLLIDKLDPAEGYNVEELTKAMWNSVYRNWTGPKFRQESKYIERKLGEIRHEAYQDIQQQLVERGTARGKGIKESDLEPLRVPDFLPFAAPVNQYYWTYFNVQSGDWPKNIAKLQRLKADGLNFTASMIEAVFELS